MTLSTHLPSSTIQEKEPVIRSLHVLSSGTADMHEEHRHGSLLPQLFWVLTSRSWVKAPINYFLIEHQDGPVLFDTGLDPAILSDPGLHLKLDWAFSVPPDLPHAHDGRGSPGPQLARLGVDAGLSTTP